MNVSIIGTGYVGLTTGACLAFLGHNVTCIDADERKVKALQAGKIPFYEPHLPELVAGARHNLSFTTEYAEAIPAYTALVERDLILRLVGAQHRRRAAH